MCRALLAVLLLSACSPAEDTRWGALSVVAFARETDGQSVGFDLDGLSSEEDGDSGCGIADYQHPDGGGGIDNAIARVVPVLEQTEGAALESLIHQNINRGEVLMVFGISGVDDPVDDDEVSLTFVRGHGAPIVGADGNIVSGQTFDRDPSLEPVTVHTGALVDGVLEAHGASVAFPVTIFDASPTLVMEDVSVHFAYDERGDFTGYVGGALNYDILLDGLIGTGIGDGLEEALPLMFESNADLDSEDGPCSRLSLTIEVQGVRAHFYDEPELD